MGAWIPPVPHLFSSLSSHLASVPALDALSSLFSSLLFHFSITTAEAQTLTSSPFPLRNHHLCSTASQLPPKETCSPDACSHPPQLSRAGLCPLTPGPTQLRCLHCLPLAFLPPPPLTRACFWLSPTLSKVISCFQTHLLTRSLHEQPSKSVMPEKVMEIQHI